MTILLFWMCFGVAGVVWLFKLRGDPDARAVDRELTRVMDLASPDPLFRTLMFVEGLVLGPVAVYMSADLWRAGRKVRKMRAVCSACGCRMCKQRLRGIGDS